MTITKRHLMALGLFMTGLATQISSLHSWSDSVSTLFVSGVVMNLGSIIIAAASDRLFSKSDE